MTNLIDLYHYRIPDENYPVSIFLSELTAADELSVEGINTRSAVKLLDRLIDKSQLSDSFDVSDLSVSDRDWILSQLYQHYWNDRILSSLHCERCDEPFDLSFQLSKLTENVFSTRNNWRVKGNAEVELSPEINPEEAEEILKIPTYRQEKHLFRCNDKSALSSLSKQVNDSHSSEKISDWLESAAPILDLELSASCPECDSEYFAHFDIQSYFLQKLINEKTSTLSEIHLIASTYGWSLSEIQSLPRSVRQTMANLILDAM